MKQKLNIKKLVMNHSDVIMGAIYGVVIFAAFVGGEKIGRRIGESDCNNLWNEACDAAGVDKMMLYNAVTEKWTKIRNKD